MAVSLLELLVDLNLIAVASRLLSFAIPTTDISS